jgi:hypothetical protein
VGGLEDRSLGGVSGGGENLGPTRDPGVKPVVYFFHAGSPRGIGSLVMRSLFEGLAVVGSQSSGGRLVFRFVVENKNFD